MRADFTSHDYPSHTHDAFVIAATELGGARVRSRGTVGTICSDTLFVSNPEEPQSAWMGDCPRWRYRSIYLTGPAIETVAHGLGIENVPYFTRNLVSDLGLVYGFGQLHQALEEGCDSFFEQECLVSVFADLFRRHGCGGNRVASAPRDQTLARKVVALMQERYAESLHLTDLANAAGLTNFQLIGLFKRTDRTNAARVPHPRSAQHGVPLSPAWHAPCPVRAGVWIL